MEISATLVVVKGQSILWNFVTPQVTTGQLGQIFVPHRKL